MDFDESQELLRGRNETVWQQDSLDADGMNGVVLSEELVSLRTTYTTSASESLTGNVRGLDDAFDSWKQYLLVYCKFLVHPQTIAVADNSDSNRIALEMVVIDDKNNGWRHLILPVAYTDKLVGDAVLAASAFHFSANIDEHQFRPSLYYQKVIKQLRQRQDLTAYDIAGKQAVFLTLLVLLSATMVSGGSDFRILFKLLETALDTIGGEEELCSGELGVFLVNQIRKYALLPIDSNTMLTCSRYRSYISPFLSREEGLQHLSLTSTIRPSLSNGWTCFRSYYNLYSQYTDSMDMIYELNEIACSIYVTRALETSSTPKLISLVEEFKTKYASLPSECPGEHTLVWSVFLAAAASTLPEHSAYFADVLSNHYRRNGFGNLVAIREQLQRIWQLSDDEDWTQILPKLEVFVV